MTQRQRHLRSAFRLRAHPRLEALETLILPTVELSPVTLVGDPAFEGGTISISGKTTVIQPIGSARLLIDWGDGTAVEVRTVPEGADVPFTFSHVVQDDDPTVTKADTVTVNVRLEDTGPRTLTTQDGGKYRAYDVPFLNINLGTSLAADKSGTSGIKSAGLDSANDSAVVVPLTGTFRFYGQDFTGINVTDNGLLSFNGQVKSGNNTGLNATSKIALICPFWDDLRTDTSLSDRVLYRSVDIDGLGGDDYFIIEWSTVPRVNNGNTNTGTFQVLLQMNTGAVNGDILFNYVDTDFGDSNIDFGRSATIGIQSGGTPQSGFTDVTNFRTAAFKNGQAVRFSVLNNLTINQNAGPDGFGYTAWTMPFEVKLDLEPTAPGAANGNVTLLGGAGAFDDISANVASAVFRPADTFNYYGKIFDATSTINVSDNGLIVFNGVNSSGTNTDLTTTPTQAVIASLWDQWAGSASISFVLGRTIDFDGDGKSEFLVVEWSKMSNSGAPDDPATWQAILELNTDPRDAGDIYFNYRDTTVGDTAFNAGASATVGIKDAGPQNVANARRVLVQHGASGINLADQRAIGLFQTFTPPQSVTVTITNLPPALIVGGNVTINEGDQLTRVISFTDPSGTVYTDPVSGNNTIVGDFFNYTIDFGDGTPIQGGVVAKGGRTFPFAHYYADDGKYTVSINLVDDDSLAAVQQQFTVTVLNVNPIITFTAPDLLIKPQQLANFPTIASFIDPGFTYPPAGTQEVFTYRIDWGDGQVTQVTNFKGTPGGPGVPTSGTFGASHPYLTPGTFTVTVTITDDDGGSSSTTFFVGVGSPHLTVYGADEGGGPLVVAFDTKLRTGEPAFAFYAYDERFRGGVRVAAADITRDTLADIVTAAGPSGGPHVKVFDGATGALVYSFFAYAANFTGGVYVATGDVDGDTVPDIITGPGKGGGPHVKVFSGATGAEIRNFFAYTAAFTGGVRVASADVNGDGFADIITGAGPGGGPHVRVFSGATGGIISEFFAYAASFTGGVNVSAGDLDGNGTVEIATGPGLGGGPLVRIFNGTTGARTNQFNAYAPGAPGYPPPVTGDQLWASGLYVGMTDLDSDGEMDLVVGPGAGRISNVRIFDGTTLAMDREYVVFDPTFLGGAFVGGN